jgi:hypothetical protein
MTSEPEVTFGLMLEAKVVHGYRHVTATMMKRRGNDSHPLNCGASWEKEERERDGLALEGYVSTSDGQFVLGKPCYSGRHRIEAADAAAMASMLSKVTKAVIKAEAYEPGDVFMAFAKATGAAWAVCTLEDGARYSSYSDTDWRWMSLAQGRDRFRTLISRVAEEQSRFSSKGA